MITIQKVLRALQEAGFSWFRIRDHFVACHLKPTACHIHNKSMSNGIALNETKVIDHATKEYILIMHNVLSLIAFLWCSQIPYLIGLNPKIERT